ncbi:periplasmic protease [Lachnospiraceae bacterium JC7]|nr:periplasmic protease [Lachnospiraceae bacterium JC7]
MKRILISLTLVSALSINLVACGSSGSNETTASASIEASDVVDAQVTTEPTTKQSTKSPEEVNEAQETGAYDVAQLEVVDPDGKASTISGFMKEGIPVPYVDVVEYMNKVYDTVNVFSLSSQGSGVYKISNAKGNMTVDTVKDTLHSDKIEQFLYNDQRLNPTDDTEYVYEHIIATDYRKDPYALDIDLSNYGIDIIEEDGKVYFPLTTAADFTGVSYLNTVYYDNKIYLNYSSDKPSVNWEDYFNKEVRDAGEIAYTYGELCFVMDNIYGNAPHCILAESIRDKGFDATLESYSDETRQVKELLNSDKTVDLLFGTIILSTMLYDGGHTDLSTDILTDLDGTTAFAELGRIVKEEPDNIRTVLYRKWYGDYISKMEAKMIIKEYGSEFDKYQAVFDEETEEGQRYRYYEFDDTGIFVYTNYDDNAVRNFKKALDLAKEHGMKNFIFDDSDNGGGSTESCMYMLNAVTKDKRDEFYYESAMTGNATYEKLDYDMDQDGKFEGDDEDFDYGFNYAVMCSQGSFSSGNLFPCLCKEAGIPIIGEKSAGGTCNLVFFKMNQGVQYSASAFRVFNYQNGGNVEAGVSPDYDITKKNTDGTTDYSDFRNFELLDQIVDDHYGT